MAMQSYSDTDLLRVLVFSDPLSAEDYQIIRTYLTIALQLRYPRKRVDIFLWCSSRSHSLAEKLDQIGHQSKFLAENNLPPCNWFLPLLFLPNEVPATADAHLSYSWSLHSQKIALAADTVASHTLLTTIAHSSSNSRAFSTGINSWIAKLATAGGRYLLDLNTILSEAPTSTPTWSLICDDIASFISDQESAWDNSEDDLLESLYEYLETHTIESEEGSFEVTYRKRVGQTRKYFRHGYTEAQLAYWRRELDKRCVLHIQNTPKAKRTQNSRMRITRPDRVTAESFLGSASSSPRKSKNRETARNKENPPNRNWNTPSTTSPIKDTSSTKAGFSGQGSANGVVVNALLELRRPYNSYANLLNQLNLVNNNKRTHQEAFDEQESSIGVGRISPESESFAAMPGFSNPLSEAALTEKDSKPKPNISHPVFSRSYATFKSPRERHKRGKVVVLKCTPKAEANPVAPANGGRQRSSSISADRNSMVVEERDSSPNIPMEDRDVMDLDSPASPHPDRSPKGNSRASAPFARNINCTNHLPDYASNQRLVSDAALLARNPDPRGSNKLRNFPRIDAGDYANTLELETVNDSPDYVFNPHLRTADVIPSFQGDLCRDAAFDSMKPELLAQMTGTIEPRVLGRMTSDEVVEAHLPVLEGYKAVYPGLFDEPAPPPADPPPPPPVLQVNGQIVRMRRDLIPNPLNLSASYPSQYQGAGGGFSAGQAQSQAPPFAPKFGMAASAAFGVLVSQAQLPSPVSPDVFTSMADDLSMVRNTPEVRDNFAHVSRPLSSTPPSTPDLPRSSQASRASQTTPDIRQPTPHFQSVPDDVRQHWLGSISRNIRAGNCSFCGLAKEDPSCGHVITNRLELEEVEADKAVRHASWQAQAEPVQARDQESQVQEGQAQAQAKVQARHQGQEEVIVAPSKRKRGRPPGSKNTAKTEKTAETSKTAKTVETAETAETTNSAETAKHAEASRPEKSPSWIREAKAEAEEAARVEAAKEAEKRQKHGPDAIDIALREASAAFGVPRSDSQDRSQGQTQTQTQVSIPNPPMKLFSMVND